MGPFGSETHSPENDGTDAAEVMVLELDEVLEVVEFVIATARIGTIKESNASMADGRVKTDMLKHNERNNFSALA